MKVQEAIHSVNRKGALRVIFAGALIFFGLTSHATNAPLDQWTEFRSLEGNLAPTGPAGTWTEKDGVMTGTGASEQWSARLLPGDRGTNQKVALKFNVLKSSGAQFALPGGCYRWSFYWGENQPGWDFGVVLRFKDPLNFYRVQVSAARGELAFWDSTGGFLQIVPCGVKVNELHALEITAQGAHFRVSMDGRDVLDYWDRTLPHMGGQVGLAAYKSTVSVESFTVEKVKADSGSIPPHKPNFRFDTSSVPVLYDGNEPISYFIQNPDKSLLHEAVKLKPGWRPTFYTAIGPNLNRPDVNWLPLVGKLPEALKVEGGGETITYSFATEKPGVAHADYSVAVRFDAARGVYRYEYRGKMKVLGDQPLANLGEFEWLDPLCYNNRIPGPEVTHAWNPAGHRWNVFQSGGNNWQRYPIVDFLVAYNNQQVAWGKFMDFLYPDPAACPAFEFEIGWEQPKGRIFKIGQCNWGYDYHHSEVGDGISLVPGTERALNMTWTAIPPAEADQLFAQSKLPSDLAQDATKLIPFDPRGTSFTKTTTWQDPSATMIWEGGALDEATGHGDRASLRIDGPDNASLHMYQHIIEQKAKRWWVRGWFKTKGLRGRGLELKVKYAYGNEPIETFFMGGLGDKDWTPFSFITTVPSVPDCTDVIFEADGPGLVWLDDVAFSALREGDNPDVTSFPVPAGLEPNKEVLIDLPMNLLPGKAVYDESRNGHALYLTNVTWAQQDGKGFLVFNGTDSSARLPLKTVLEPHDPPMGTTGTEIYKPIFALDRFTYEFLARPRMPVAKDQDMMMAVHYRNNPMAYFDQLHTKPGECRFVWQNNIFQGKEIKLSKNVPYDQWSHFAVTHGDGKVTLYVNGRKEGEEDYDVNAAGFTFFAYNREYFAGSFLGKLRWLTGDLGLLRLYPKTLTAEEVARRFQKIGAEGSRKN